MPAGDRPAGARDGLFGFIRGSRPLIVAPFTPHAAPIVQPNGPIPPMTEKTPSAAKPAAKTPLGGDDRNIVPADAASTGESFELWLHEFWSKNRTVVYVAIVAVILIIVGREAWQVYQARQEQSVRAAYASATDTEARRQFAREHAGHPLAGLALLALADEAYARSDYAAAGRTYTEALADIKEPALVARARLGEAMAALQAGLVAKGEPLLRQLAEDTTVLDAIRIEAWYHLASLEVSEGDSAAANASLDKFQALLMPEMQATGRNAAPGEATRAWFMRGASLRARIQASAPAPAADAPPADAPAPATSAPEAAPATTP